MITKIVLFILLVSSIQALAQKSDKKLQTLIAASIQKFNGEVGIYIKNLRTGKIAAVNADSIFPTASIVKVPILVGIMDKIQKGELMYDEQFIYKDSLLYEGVDILGSFKSGERIELKKTKLPYAVNYARALKFCSNQNSA